MASALDKMFQIYGQKQMPGVFSPGAMSMAPEEPAPGGMSMAPASMMEAAIPGAVNESIAGGGAQPGGPTPGDPSFMEMIAQSQKKTPSELAAEKELEKRYRESIEEQKGGIKQAEGALLKMASKDEGTDLSPLLAVVDAWTGSSFAKGYRPPLSGEQRQLQVAKMQDLINRRKGDLSKTEMKHLQNQLKTSSNERFLNMIGRHQRHGMEFTLKRENELGKTLRDEIRKPITKFLSSIAVAQKAIESNEVGQVLPVLTSIARTIGEEKGNMAESDVKRVLTGTLGMDWAKVKAYITSDPRAKTDPKVTGALRALLQNARDAKYEVYKDTLGIIRGDYSQRGSFDDLMGEGASGTGMFDNAGGFVEKIRGASQGDREPAAEPAAEAPAAPPTGGSGPGGFDSFEEFRKKRNAGQP